MRFSSLSRVCKMSSALLLTRKFLRTLGLSKLEFFATATWVLMMPYRGMFFCASLMGAFTRWRNWIVSVIFMSKLIFDERQSSNFLSSRLTSIRFSSSVPSWRRFSVKEMTVFASFALRSKSNCWHWIISIFVARHRSIWLYNVLLWTWSASKYCDKNVSTSFSTVSHLWLIFFEMSLSFEMEWIAYVDNGFVLFFASFNISM